MLKNLNPLPLAKRRTTSNESNACDAVFQNFHKDEGSFVSIFWFIYYLDGKDYILSLFVGKVIELTVHNETARVRVDKDLSGSWTQLAVSWTSLTG